ncbi:MAG: hypothetical protein DWC06_07860, partial [Candidatus Poseidoniales archaeon]
MNTEELEQPIEEGANNNTASHICAIAVCHKGSFKAPSPVQNLDTISVSFVSLPNQIAQPCCALDLERENSGF